MSWALQENRGSAGGIGGAAALRSGAAALAVLGEGVGRKCEEWEAGARAQVRCELNGGVRACEGLGAEGRSGGACAACGGVLRRAALMEVKAQRGGLGASVAWGSSATVARR